MVSIIREEVKAPPIKRIEFESFSKQKCFIQSCSDSKDIIIDIGDKMIVLDKATALAVFGAAIELLNQK